MKRNWTDLREGLGWEIEATPVMGQLNFNLLRGPW